MFRLIGRGLRGVGRGVRWWFKGDGDRLLPPLRGILTVAVLVFTAGAAVALTVGNHTGHVACARLHQQTTLPTRYVRGGPDVLWTGDCFIKLGPKRSDWVPVDRWRPGN